MDYPLKTDIFIVRITVSVNHTEEKINNLLFMLKNDGIIIPRTIIEYFLKENQYPPKHRIQSNGLDVIWVLFIGGTCPELTKTPTITGFFFIANSESTTLARNGLISIIASCALK